VSDASAKLLIDAYQKLQYLSKNHLELTVSLDALTGAIQERFPDLPLAHHREAVEKTASIRKLREQLKAADVSIAAAKRQLLGEESN
jgi:hypothetical protein